MNKKIKFLVSLFALSLILGGINVVSAQLVINLEDYKADFLGEAKQTAKQTKTTTSAQLVNIETSTGDRHALISLWTNNNSTDNNNMVSSSWQNVWTGKEITFGGTFDMVTSADANARYFLKTKLAAPWFQVVLNGTWTVDK